MNPSKTLKNMILISFEKKTQLKKSLKYHLDVIQTSLKTALLCSFGSICREFENNL